MSTNTCGKDNTTLLVSSLTHQRCCCPRFYMFASGWFPEYRKLACGLRTSILRTNQSENICERKRQHHPPRIVNKRNLPQPPGRRVYPIHWGLGFNAPRPQATPMASPPWGQSMKFKVRAPPDRFIGISWLRGGWRSVAGDLVTTDGD